MGNHSANSFGIANHKAWLLCADVISYNKEEGARLLSCLVIRDGIIASSDSRTEWKTTAALYLAVIHNCSLINLCYPFIWAPVDSLDVTYKKADPTASNYFHQLTAMHKYCLPSILHNIRSFDFT